jgi:hypothetical protein
MNVAVGVTEGRMCDEWRRRVRTDTMTPSWGPYRKLHYLANGFGPVTYFAPELGHKQSEINRIARKIHTPQR